MQDKRKAVLYPWQKSSMQSGRGGVGLWVVEVASSAPKSAPDPLMGWSGGFSTQKQCKFFFPSKEEAELFATQKDLELETVPRRQKKPQIKSYAENYSNQKKIPWTH